MEPWEKPTVLWAERVGGPFLFWPLLPRVESQMTRAPDRKGPENE